MTKDARHDPRLAEQFRALDTLPLPPELALRLRATVPLARAGSRPFVAATAALVLVAAGFLVGRISSPPTVVSRIPPVTAPAVMPISLLGTTRDGNVVSVRIAGSGIEQIGFAKARLRFSDGTDIAPETAAANADGSVTLLYVLPYQFAFTRTDVRLELPLGTGLWVQSVDLR